MRPCSGFVSTDSAYRPAHLPLSRKKLKLMTSSQRWHSIVGLMRSDIATMAADPANAGRYLLRVTALHERMLIQLARQASMHLSDLQAVLVIWDSGRVSMTELARRLGITRSQVTTILDRLEDDNLAERVRDPDDARQYLVHATHKADRLLLDGIDTFANAIGNIARDEPTRWQASIEIASETRTAINAETAHLQERKFQRPPNRTKPAKPKPETTTGW